jgi:hypothetical protein
VDVVEIKKKQKKTKRNKKTIINMNTNELVQSSASLGKLLTAINLGLSVIVSLMLVIGGIVLALKRKQYTEETVGTIVDNDPAYAPPFCHKGVCDHITLTYSVGKNSYKVRLDNVLVEDSKRYVVGKTVPVFYDKKDNSKISLEKSMDSHPLGGIMIFSGLAVLTVALFFFWLVRKNNAAAVLTGPLGLFRMI